MHVNARHGAQKANAYAVRRNWNVSHAPASASSRTFAATFVRAKTGRTVGQLVRGTRRTGRVGPRVARHLTIDFEFNRLLPRRHPRYVDLAVTRLLRTTREMHIVVMALFEFLRPSRVRLRETRALLPEVRTLVILIRGSFAAVEKNQIWRAILKQSSSCASKLLIETDELWRKFHLRTFQISSGHFR